MGRGEESSTADTKRLLNDETENDDDKTGSANGLQGFGWDRVRILDPALVALFFNSLGFPSHGEL